MLIPLLTALATPPAAPALVAARIDVSLEPDGALVSATYRVSGADSVRLVLIRLRDQSIEGLDASGRVEALDGLTRVSVRPDERGEIALRYRVRGPLDRIPIAVPSMPPARETRAVVLRLTGLDPRITLADAFPRLRATEGAAEATLAAVPSVVRLPAPSGWSLLRVLDFLVVALVLGASVLWYVRFRPRAAR
jgi:hypothetical protein